MLVMDADPDEGFIRGKMRAPAAPRLERRWQKTPVCSSKAATEVRR